MNSQGTRAVLLNGIFCLGFWAAKALRKDELQGRRLTFNIAIVSFGLVIVSLPLLWVVFFEYRADRLTLLVAPIHGFAFSYSILAFLILRRSGDSRREKPARRYRLLLWLASFILVFVCLWPLADWILNGPASRMNYEKIHLGMTLPQAESIVREKAGRDWNPTNLYFDSEEMQAEGPRALANEGLPFTWTSSSHRIVVMIDPKGVVIGKAYFCNQDVNGIRRVIDMLPLWSNILVGVIGLLLFAYLCWTRGRKSWSPKLDYTPTLPVLIFMSQKEE